MRLRHYDYSTSGAYFITICTQARVCLFGRVVDGEMEPSEAGKMIAQVWDEIPLQYPDVELDESVVMPNHFHGIIVLGDQGRAQGPAPTSIPDIICHFKSLTTARYRHGVNALGWNPFPGKLWQRSYHDHVIRNQYDLDAIREYILSNPAGWTQDEQYVA
jgi:REP element-mobilizing transposase RayT